MNILSTLYFPETAPDRNTLRNLLLFFDTIACYRPVENDPPLDPLLHGEGLVTESTPAPLGDEKAHFLRLINDAKQNGLQYLEGFLSSLAIQAAKDRDEAASWSLFSRLKKTSPDPDVDRAREALWQARFILKLAEVYAEEEREIQSVLRAAEAGKKKLLQALHGTEDDDLSEEAASGDAEAAAIILPDLSAPDQLRLPLSAKRLISFWANFFIRDTTADGYWILATAMEEAAAELIDTCTGPTDNQGPLLLATLPLSDVAGLPDTDYCAARLSFRRQHRQWLDSIANGIKMLAYADDICGDEGRRVIVELEKTFQSWPAGEVTSSDNQIALYLLPGLSTGQLINRFVRKPRAVVGKNQPRNTVLAILRKQKG